MSNWLLKSDPEDYSFADLEREKKTVWDGVRNNLALIHLRSIRKEDVVFIYHTGSEKQIVGEAIVTSDPYPDPKLHDNRYVVVEIQLRRRLKNPVSLEQIKSLKEFEKFDLVRLPRLSVMPVDERTWRKIVELSR